MRALVAVVVVVSSCAKCGAGAAVGSGAPAQAEPLRFSTDLRTVVLTIFPEYRGTFVRSGLVRLTRTYSAPADWLTPVRAAFTKNKVVERPADAGVEGTFDLFVFRADGDGSRGTVSIEIAVDGETLSRLYTNPASLSTSQLGLYLPREGITVSRDDFEFELVYDATTERRAAFLTRQVVELMLSNQQWTLGAVPAGWEPNPPDGGYGEVPEQFVVTLTGVVDGARVIVRRDHTRVTMRYELLTFAPTKGPRQDR